MDVFDKRATSGALAVVRKIFDSQNNYFPATTAIQSGSMNAHLKEELRATLNRLINNTELNLVKLQIMDYVDAVDKGLIIDNRPKP